MSDQDKQEDQEEGQVEEEKRTSVTQDQINEGLSLVQRTAGKHLWSSQYSILIKIV